MKDIQSGKLYKVGISAEAFGFGPASKATAIMKRLEEWGRARGLILADSIAHEFLRREGFASIKPLHPSRKEDLPTIEQVTKNLDAAIVVLDPIWVDFLVPRMPVVFVDSLGFMWPPEHFECHNSLLNVDSYIVQDVFDSVPRLRAMGIKNLFPVGAITNVLGLTHFPTRGAVVHLGGLANIFSMNEGIKYAKFVGDLLDEVVHSLPTTPVLMSEYARKECNVLNDFSTETLEHESAIDLFANASLVYSSPGLTTLLELAALQTPMVPLPPQNLSQSRIVCNMVKNYKKLHKIWHLLADTYRIPENVSESQGVAMVTDINHRLAKCTEFRAKYQTLAQEASKDALPIPQGIVENYDGVNQCANCLLSVI